jgi:hypothetical protein
MQNVELRAVALGKRLRSAALKHGFGLNQAGLIIHEAMLCMVRGSPDVTPDPKGADQRIGVMSAPSAWGGR